MSEPCKDNVTSLSGYVDVGADTAAIDQVGAGFKAGSETVGNVSLGFTVLLDLAATGVAIEGIYQASSAWEAFKLQHAELQKLWDECALIYGGFVRFAEQMKAATALLGDEIKRRKLAIDQLEAAFGGGLYDV